MEKNNSGKLADNPSKAMVKADPRLRKKTLVIIALALIVGLVLLYYFRTFLQGVENLADESPQEAVNRLLVAFRVVMVAMIVGFVAFALYLWRISLRTFKSKQFPPPGIHVTRDTEMITGERAKLRGMMGLMVAATLAVFGLLLAWYVYRMIQGFLAAAAGANGA